MASIEGFGVDTGARIGFIITLAKDGSSVGFFDIFYGLFNVLSIAGEAKCSFLL